MDQRTCFVAFVGKIFLSAFLVLGASEAALAQAAAPPPPAVGVQRAEKKPITEKDEFNGRILAINRVDIVARVTAFVDSVEFKDGQEVKTGDILYRLERPPFEADLEAKKAVAEQYQAQLVNANAALDRAQTLLKGPAGLQSNYDSALATQKSYAAQLLGAQAAVKQSEINLGYTQIASPIDGKIGRTAITLGNVVSPSSGVLVTIVGQDPMYVLFPVSVRTLLALRNRYVPLGGFNAVVIRVTLPNGQIYDQTGKLTFVDNTVQTATDTVMMRATIANPPILDSANKQGQSVVRQLTDGEFVTVNLEGVQPVLVLSIPRSAVLTDQRGDYVYVVDADNKAQRRDIQLGQSTPADASIISGLTEGELVVVEGIQRVRAGELVSPGPPTPGPAASSTVPK
ncbi:efflux RND transporter periplasmic adaptor subunit [Methyloferula stellata]|uniref:efflux RND transporter periplasmic adaptor subunit n=1 Tax=Methyloferula stellata TaxID=876270 RepID=UPI0003697F32|nr:efflux RND transporter periplasmic adaptor subunit [Methyloferula stellata]